MCVFPGLSGGSGSTDSTEYRVAILRSYPVCVHGAPRTIRRSCLLHSKSCYLLKKPTSPPRDLRTFRA